MAQHRGWIEVESKVGSGTCFRIFLPAGIESSVPDAAGRANGPFKGGHERILVVEDEARVRLVIAQSLRLLGYSVLEAGNGREAVALWHTHGGHIDLLLTDMVMPEGMTGLDLAQQLKALKPGLRIIISSGYAVRPHSSAH